jgi:hypothetical protein
MSESAGIESTGIESTGIGSIDAVVAGLGVLDDLPVGEHVAVFEQAHESLRASMADRTNLSSGVAVGETSQA